MKSKKVRYREVRRVCGDYMHVYVYPVYPVGEHKTPSGNRRKIYAPTSAVQEMVNCRNSERAFAETAHANFCGDDYAVSLSYDDGWLAEDDKTAVNDLSCFIRRLKRLYAKHGIEFKFMAASPARGESRGRYHDHLIIPGGVPREEIQAKWGMGYCNVDNLQFSECGIMDLSVYYVTKQDKVGYKRWSGSRNLKKPIEKPSRDHTYDRKVALEVAESPYRTNILSELYPGYTLAEYPRATDNPVNGGVYMEMLLYSDDADFIQRRQGKGKYKKQKQYVPRRSSKDRGASVVMRTNAINAADELYSYKPGDQMLLVMEHEDK